MSAAAGAVVMALRWGRRGVAVLLGAALLAGGLWSLQVGWTERLNSIFDLERNLDRITLWWTALRIFETSPIVGRGPGSFSKLQTSFMPETGYTEIHATPHNLLLALAADIGLLGLATFGWLVARAARMGRFLWRKGDAFSVGLVAAVVAVFVNDLFGHGFYAMEIASVMWFGLGLVEARYTEGRSQRSVAAGERGASRADLSVRASEVAEPDSISVVLPVRNRAGLVRACLESLMRAAERLTRQGVAVEIVVADDASTDETPEVLAQVAASSPIPVRIIRLTSRQGPGRARNAALEQARGELVVFVDSDVVVDEAFLEAHLLAHRQGGVGVYTVGAVIAVPYVEAARHKPGASVWDFSSAPLDTANAAVRKEHLEAVGRFDPGFKGMGWQDIDLGMRLRGFGLKRVAVREAVGYHIQPPIETQAQLEARISKERERGESAVYFMAKHPGLEARLAAQDTAVHRGLNWLFRMGGLVNERNVLAWMRWARRRRLVALEKMWLAGVVNQAYLESLVATRRMAARGVGVARGK